MFKRPSNRNFNELRNISLEANFSPYAEGSCFAKFGNTHVLCTASVESKLPLWIRNSGKGWITAEYGMLPRSTHSRMDREVTKGKPSGRTQEIQRLIGRSLRSVVNLGKLAEFQIKVDCDVIQADGGTRTASITGAWVALYQAINFLLKSGKLSENPIIDQVAAISCGICENQELIDLDYEEDSSAETDGNQNKEIKELKDQLLRSLAESENLRKRTIKEIADAKKYSHIYFIRDLVSSVDNLQRALEAVPDDKSQLSEPIKNLVIGLEIVEKEILNTFEKHSLKQINPLGEKFDYNLHQAMFEVPTNEKEPGYVVEVSQKGYILHDRLVRPAMVGISKKSEEDTTEQNNKENEKK